MREYRVICKSDRGFLNAILASTREDTRLEINESQRELIIPEFEAYRTGLPEIRKILKSKDVLLRSVYFDFKDYEYTIKEGFLLITTGTLGNLAKIDNAYNRGIYLNIYTQLEEEGLVYIGSDFRLVFLGPNRIPAVRYRPTYTNLKPVDISIQELVEANGRTDKIDDTSLSSELTVICKLFPKLVKI